ncbi:MAG: hypothetical protein EX271_05645 [Acidimicrobiales bacterium]|nr:MAG: hypothetical protein EX271_05645 [Acidimicrobiales bacterium]
MTKHVKDQNWFAVALDFVIVVAGILIAFQITNWNEAKKGKLIAEEYLERIETDLHWEIRYLGRVSDYYGTARAHAVSALDAWSQPAENLGVDFLIDLYQASQSWNLTQRRATYDELLATGRIGLLPSASSRSSINNYYENGLARFITLQNNTQVNYRKTIRSHMSDVVQRAIRENCGDEHILDQDNTYYIRLPERCEIVVPAEIVRAAVNALFANNEVKLELRFQLASHDTLLASMRNAIDTANRLLADLEGTSE